MDVLTHPVAIWLGILFCVTQSGLLSGLNLAYFSLTRLRLEVEARTGNEKAVRVLEFRSDYHTLLVTILWGNVGVNVLLALLTESVMTGVGAFLFSTVIITLFGEIVPQAVFSRYALTFGYWLAPVMSIYRFVLYPISKPVGLLLDRMLGRDGIQFFREPDLKQVIREHVESHKSDIGFLEGVGALNFLTMDDVIIEKEGNELSEKSIVKLDTEPDGVRFPSFDPEPSDPFLQRLHRHEKKWMVFVDESGDPLWVLHVPNFLRHLFFDGTTSIQRFCHEPVVVRETSRRLGSVLNELEPYHPEPPRTERDVILVWGAQKRIITGRDLFHRLLRGTHLFGM